MARRKPAGFVPAWPGQVCSLGYQVGPLIEADLGITLTGEQQDRIIAYYALHPVTGRRLVRRAALRRPKGAGKSPEGAWCGYAELVGPVVFDGWVDSQPVGRHHDDPWIQFAAVSEDQTDNVLVWLFDTLNARPDVCAERGVNLGRTRIYLDGRAGRLEPVTASAGSREGQRITFAVLDQTESWFKENGGLKLANTLRRNAAKMGGWSLELQNAPELGDGSVADETAKASEGKSAGVLFDTREPPGHDKLDMTNPKQLRKGLEFAYGESTAWVDVGRLIEEILDPATDPSDGKRYYLNVAAPSSDWAFDRAKWTDELGVGDLVPDKGALIVAGFDGARHDDAVALVGCEVATGNMWTVAVWERPADADDTYEHPELEVNDAVDGMFTDFQVWRMYCDPPYWETTVATWAGKYKGSDRKPAVVSWYTKRWSPVGVACRSFASAIRAGEIHHHVDAGDDDVLTRHVRNAVKRPVPARDEDGKPLWTIRKATPGRKIDAAMAAVLAWEARRDAITAGANEQRRNTAVFI